MLVILLNVAIFVVVDEGQLIREIQQSVDCFEESNHIVHCKHHHEVSHLLAIHEQAEHNL
jgi:hypothetical protein